MKIKNKTIITISILIFQSAFCAERRNLVEYYSEKKCAGCPQAYFDVAQWIVANGEDPSNYVFLTHYSDNTIPSEVLDEAHEYWGGQGWPAITFNRKNIGYGVEELRTSKNTPSNIQLQFQNTKWDANTNKISGEISIQANSRLPGGNYQLHLITAEDGIIINGQSNGEHPNIANLWLYNLGNPISKYKSHYVAKQYIYPKYGKQVSITSTAIIKIAFDKTLTPPSGISQFIVAYISNNDNEVLDAIIQETSSGAVPYQYPNFKQYNCDEIPEMQAGIDPGHGVKVQHNNSVYACNSDFRIMSPCARENSMPLADNWLRGWFYYGSCQGSGISSQIESSSHVSISQNGQSSAVFLSMNTHIYKDNNSLFEDAIQVFQDKNQLKISTFPQNYRLQIFSIDGTLLSQWIGEDQEDYSISIQGFTKGIYYYKFFSDNNAIHGRIKW